MPPNNTGATRIRYNTRERVLSGDHNREQALGNQILAEVLRCMTDAAFELDTQAGSVEVFGLGNESLPRATILAGIRPRPEVGTVNLFIEAGTIAIVDNPSPTVDGSRLAMVSDPGVQTAGLLTLTPGFGGAIRIDVIECQRLDVTLETDSRDIFDPVTGLFTPTLVDKIIAARLTYRIRLGTPGLGFPGIDPGWIPLAVCSVPAGAVTWNDVTLWDVRPLAHERVQQPFNAAPSFNYAHRHSVWTDLTTAPGEVRVNGIADVSFGAYRAGGKMIHPGTTNEWINVADTSLWATAFSNPSSCWYLYVVFPFGLPRWVQYCPASAGIREPRGLRGIPVVSRWTPSYDGRPLTPIAQTPAWTGLADLPSRDAMVTVAGFQGPGGGPFGIIGDGRIIQFVNQPTVEFNATTTAGPGGALSSTWDFTDNVTHAGNARAVYVQFRLELNVTGSAGNLLFQKDVFVSGPTNTATNEAEVALADGPQERMYTDINGTYTIGFTARIPLAIDAANNAQRGFKVRWGHVLSGPTFTITARKALILGWELGP